jgi:hypothetical protein
LARATNQEIDKLRQFADNEHFRAFEREIEEGIERELDDRKYRLEEVRRTREKKARRRRLKKQAALVS